MFKDTLQEMLEAEMTTRLGYDKLNMKKLILSATLRKEQDGIHRPS